MRLLGACALTVALETAFFAVLGYRSRAFVALCVCANVLTNLSLNLLLWLLAGMGAPPALAVYPLEILAVAAEFAIYAALLGKSGRLLGLTLAANCLSYGVGLLLFGHV